MGERKKQKAKNREKRIKMDIDIEEKVNQGWIHARFTIEVQGNDKAHVKKSLDKLAEAFAKKKYAIGISKNLDAITEVSDGWYSNFMEIEALIETFEGIMEIATQFSPSTMEILAPKEIKIPASELQTTVVDISSLISTFAHAAFLARKELKSKK